MTALILLFMIGRYRQLSQSRTPSRLRAVSYFSLQSYCKRNTSTRAASVLIPYCNKTLWFAVALAEN